MVDETLLEAGEKMDKSVEALKNEFASIRTGRANPSLFANLTADYYGAPTPLQQLASFQTPKPVPSSSPPTTRVHWVPLRRQFATQIWVPTPLTTVTLCAL